MMGNVQSGKILDGAITTATGETKSPLGPQRTFIAYGNTSVSTGASTIGIQVSNDGIVFKEVKEFSLTLGVAITSDVYEMNAAWKFVRAVVKTISGTDASVTVEMGVQL